MITWMQLPVALLMSAFFAWNCRRSIRSGVFTQSGLSVRKDEKPTVFWTYVCCVAVMSVMAFLMAIGCLAMVVTGNAVSGGS